MTRSRSSEPRSEKTERKRPDAIAALDATTTRLADVRSNLSCVPSGNRRAFPTSSCARRAMPQRVSASSPCAPRRRYGERAGEPPRSKPNRPGTRVTWLRRKTPFAQASAALLEAQRSYNADRAGMLAESLEEGACVPCAGRPSIPGSRREAPTPSDAQIENLERARFPRRAPVVMTAPCGRYRRRRACNRLQASSMRASRPSLTRCRLSSESRCANVSSKSMPSSSELALAEDRCGDAARLGSSPRRSRARTKRSPNSWTKNVSSTPAFPSARHRTCRAQTASTLAGTLAHPSKQAARKELRKLEDRLCADADVFLDWPCAKPRSPARGTSNGEGHGRQRDARGVSNPDLESFAPIVMRCSSATRSSQASSAQTRSREPQRGLPPESIGRHAKRMKGSKSAS